LLDDSCQLQRTAFQKAGERFTLSPGERAGVRASVPTILVLIGFAAPAARHLVVIIPTNPKLRRSDIVGNIPLLTELWKFGGTIYKDSAPTALGCFGKHPDPGLATKSSTGKGTKSRF
jgi:hypothetical protein